MPGTFPHSVTQPSLAPPRPADLPPPPASPPQPPAGRLRPARPRDGQVTIFQSTKIFQLLKIFQPRPPPVPGPAVRGGSLGPRGQPSTITAQQDAV